MFCFYLFICFFLQRPESDPQPLRSEAMRSEKVARRRPWPSRGLRRRRLRRRRPPPPHPPLVCFFKRSRRRNNAPSFSARSGRKKQKKNKTKGVNCPRYSNRMPSRAGALINLAPNYLPPVSALTSLARLNPWRSAAAAERKETKASRGKGFPLHCAAAARPVNAFHSN